MKKYKVVLYLKSRGLASKITFLKPVKKRKKEKLQNVTSPLLFLLSPTVLIILRLIKSFLFQPVIINHHQAP